MSRPADALFARRNALVAALADCERGAFPGSREWRAEKAAMDALAAFDRRHPEVLAAIQADRDARCAADPNVQRALRGED